MSVLKCVQIQMEVMSVPVTMGIFWQMTVMNAMVCRISKYKYNGYEVQIGMHGNTWLTCNSVKALQQFGHCFLYNVGGNQCE